MAVALVTGRILRPHGLSKMKDHPPMPSGLAAGQGRDLYSLSLV